MSSPYSRLITFSFLFSFSIFILFGFCLFGNFHRTPQHCEHWPTLVRIVCTIERASTATATTIMPLWSFLRKLFYLLCIMCMKISTWYISTPCSTHSIPIQVSISFFSAHLSCLVSTYGFSFFFCCCFFFVYSLINVSVTNGGNWFEHRFFLLFFSLKNNFQ